MTGDEDDREDEDQAEPVDFEDVVAALLKVDPEGIIGKEGKAARQGKQDD